MDSWKKTLMVVQTNVHTKIKLQTKIPLFDVE